MNIQTIYIGHPRKYRQSFDIRKAPYEP
ncbi:hypothetical protein F383_36961 [Gossypium arboreum]|uniref:Uncharacterized protein n=1 Tax=Gossypium arboreum TaxID=29729 RepID=A0A0B0MAV3_GOSAR|nr:hypothetical protein F383_36961 [Gossypium arboreum]